MKTVHLAKRLVRIHDLDHPRSGEKDKLWAVVADSLIKIEIEDDIEVQLGWVWDGDYRSGRPTFSRAQILGDGQ